MTANFDSSLGKVYIGTSTSGIFSFRYNEIRVPGKDFSPLMSQSFTTSSTPSISSNTVNDLDSSGSNLLIGTAAGIDFIHNELNSSTRTLVSGSKDVHLTSSGGGYWTTCSGNIYRWLYR